MVSVAALCASAQCCRRKSKKKPELDEPYGIVNAGETATADARVGEVAFRSQGVSECPNYIRFSQPLTAQSVILPTQLIRRTNCSDAVKLYCIHSSQRSSVPVSHASSSVRRALPNPPVTVPLRVPMGSTSALYSAVEKMDPEKRRIHSIPYIEDSVNPTYESIDAESDSFSDPLYSKLEIGNQNGRKYDYPTFTKQNRNPGDEVMYQSASQIYAGGSEDPYSSITSHSGADDKYNGDYANFNESCENSLSFPQPSVTGPSKRCDVDQLYTKIQRDFMRKKRFHEDIPVSPPLDSGNSFDFVPYTQSESEKTSREPSYRYITVRESVDVIRQRISEREENTRRNNSVNSGHCNGLNTSHREHFYASIEGISDYESVPGNAIYEHLSEDAGDKYSEMLPSTSRKMDGDKNYSHVAPKPPTSPIPSYHDSHGVDVAVSSAMCSTSILNPARFSSRHGSALIAGPYSYFSVKSSGTAKLPAQSLDKCGRCLESELKNESNCGVFSSGTVGSQVSVGERTINICDKGDFAEFSPFTHNNKLDKLCSKDSSSTKEFSNDSSRKEDITDKEVSSTFLSNDENISENRRSVQQRELDTNEEFKVVRSGLAKPTDSEKDAVLCYCKGDVRQLSAGKEEERYVEKEAGARNNSHTSISLLETKILSQEASKLGDVENPNVGTVCCPENCYDGITPVSSVDCTPGISNISEIHGLSADGVKNGEEVVRKCGDAAANSRDAKSVHLQTPDSNLGSNLHFPSALTFSTYSCSLPKKLNFIGLGNKANVVRGTLSHSADGLQRLHFGFAKGSRQSEKAVSGQTSSNIFEVSEILPFKEGISSISTQTKKLCLNNGSVVMTGPDICKTFASEDDFDYRFLGRSDGSLYGHYGCKKERDCFCHCGRKDPVVRRIVRSNQDVMKSIKYCEIPLYSSYESCFSD